ncbi:TPA: hypothetical protein I7122_18665 [Vibrio vulnificus]|nr:hypothetical protein [Vibrio vulnificus]
MEFVCTYINASGIASIQHLSNARFDNDKEPQYVQGWCIKSNHPKTLKYSNIVQVFDCYDNAKKEFGDQDYKLPEYSKSPSTRYSSPETMDICFTGFSKSDKLVLSELAKLKGMQVRKEVTVHLNILCYGSNAGPKKLEKAMAQGVMILNREQFEKMVETGEVPECI